MTTRTVRPVDLASGMTILEVNGQPVSPPLVVGRVRQAFALPWERRRYDVWSQAGWPGGAPVMTLASGDQVKVRTVA